MQNITTTTANATSTTTKNKMKKPLFSVCSLLCVCVLSYEFRVIFFVSSSSFLALQQKQPSKQEWN